MINLSDGPILSFGIGLGANFAGGDLKERYGQNLNFSVNSEYITKNNWLINGNFFFFLEKTSKKMYWHLLELPTVQF